METAINAITGGGTLVERQRVDGSSSTSERREARVAAYREKKAPDAPEVQRAADRLNEALEGLNRNLAISVFGSTGQMVVKVTDPATGDLIRQIPPEQLLAVVESVDEIVGLIVNDTA